MFTDHICFSCSCVFKIDHEIFWRSLVHCEGKFEMWTRIFLVVHEIFLTSPVWRCVPWERKDHTHSKEIFSLSDFIYLLLKYSLESSEDKTNNLISTIYLLGNTLLTQFWDVARYFQRINRCVFRAQAVLVSTIIPFQNRQPHMRSFCDTCSWFANRGMHSRKLALRCTHLVAVKQVGAWRREYKCTQKQVCQIKPLS